MKEAANPPVSEFESPKLKIAGKSITIFQSKYGVHKGNSSHENHTKRRETDYRYVGARKHHVESENSFRGLEGR